MVRRTQLPAGQTTTGSVRRSNTVLTHESGLQTVARALDYHGDETPPAPRTTGRVGKHATRDVCCAGRQHHVEMRRASGARVLSKHEHRAAATRGRDHDDSRPTSRLWYEVDGRWLVVTVVAAAYDQHGGGVAAVVSRWLSLASMHGSHARSQSTPIANSASSYSVLLF